MCVAVSLVACGTDTASSLPAEPASAGASAEVSSTPTTTAMPSPSAMAGTPLVDVTDMEVDVGLGADFPTELAGSVWILVADLAQPTVVRLDPGTGEALASVPITGNLCEGIIAAFDSIWACGAGGVERIDPVTNAVAARIELPTARVVGRPAVTEDAVWLLSGNVVATSVVRIDPVAGEVAASHEAPYPLTALAGGLDAVWATSAEAGTLIRIDPASGEMTEVATDLPAPSLVATGHEAVWVLLDGAAGSEPGLLRFSPQDGSMDRFDIGGVPAESGDIVVGENAVWIRGSDPRIVALDPDSGDIKVRISGEGLGDGALGIADGALWLTSVDAGRVWRLDVDCC
jgi:streptogramin lyase